eukprot:m.126910 g.126910  ORF g.126910 m.126910 type:complete len:131 (+) comp19834_c0_seq1:75-467(+)
MAMSSSVAFCSSEFRFGSDLNRDSGVIRISSGPTKEQNVIYWQRVGFCVCSFLCDAAENVLMADAALSLLARTVHTQFRNASEQPSEIVQRPEEITAYLHHCLPNGLILFTNQKMHQQLAKEVEVFLTAK